MKKVIAFIKSLFAKKEEVHVGKYAEIKKELKEEKKVVAEEVPAAPKKKKKKKKTNESK
jgi:hypothetical protein